jgi:hypothetical protein
MAYEPKWADAAGTVFVKGSRTIEVEPEHDVEAIWRYHSSRPAQSE